MKRLNLLPLTLLLSLVAGAAAAAASWPPNLLLAPPSAQTAAPLVGQILPEVLAADDTLIDLARRRRLGYGNLAAANPGVDPWITPAGTRVLLPLATVLPDGIQPGITINLAELRLFHVWQDGDRHWVKQYPIGIGRIGLETPEGSFHVTSKAVNPSWKVPERIRREDPSLPDIMPPGPTNPLGDHWLGLSAEGYGIHGTHKPLGVGRRVSSGCIRMYPEDIRELFGRVEVGTPVHIVYQPIKLGQRDGLIYLQVHEDFEGRIPAPTAQVVKELARIAPGFEFKRETLQRIVRERTGVPAVIGVLPPAPPSTRELFTLPNHPLSARSR